MVDAIIILIVIVLLFFALKGSIRHFKGDGSCCRSSSSLLKTDEKHLDGPVVAVREVRISGMHCENCAEKVRRAVDSIDGASASVNLSEGKATVKMDRRIDDIVIKRKIEEAGYSVESISQI